MRFCAVVFIILVATFFQTALAAELPADPGLDKPVTIAVKGESLSDLMRALSSQTGVKLQSSRAVADQKVTVFVDAKPLREVLTGLSKLLDLHWLKMTVKGVRFYEISRDLKSEKDAAASREKILAEAWKAAETHFGKVIELSDKSDEDLQALQKKFEGMFASLPEGKSFDLTPEQVAQLTRDSADMEAAGMLTMEPGTRVCAKFIKPIKDRIFQLVRDGYVVCYDSETAESEWKLPDDVLQGLIEADKRWNAAHMHDIPGSDDSGAEEDQDHQPSAVLSSTPDRANIKFRSKVDAENLMIEAVVSLHSTDGSGSSQCNSFVMDQLVGVQPGDAKHHPSTSSDLVLQKKVSFKLPEIQAEASPAGRTAADLQIRVNRADLLSILHKKAGLQVISDYASCWQETEAASEETVGSLLDRMSMHMADFADWYFNDGFIFARVTDISANDASETPNRLLRPWQAAYAKQRGFTLDEMVQIAGLSEAQLQRLAMYSGELGLGNNDDIQFQGNLLKFYGTLSTAERKQLKSDDGLSIASLTPDQQKLLNMESDLDDSAIVGIYKDGLRVDKPGAPVRPAFAPGAAVRMTQEADRTTFEYDHTENGYTYSEPIEASDREAAWKKIMLATGIKCRRENMFVVTETPYAFAIGDLKQGEVSTAPEPKSEADVAALLEAFKQRAEAGEGVNDGTGPTSFLTTTEIVAKRRVPAF